MTLKSIIYEPASQTIDSTLVSTILGSVSLTAAVSESVRNTLNGEQQQNFIYRSLKFSLRDYLFFDSFVDDTVVDWSYCDIFVFMQSRGAAWQQVFQTSFQQRSNAGVGDNFDRSGKLLVSNLDFGVNDADIKVSFFNITLKIIYDY